MRTGKPSHKSEAGTTLAELMIAMVLLAIGILAVAQMFRLGRAGNSGIE